MPPLTFSYTERKRQQHKSLATTRSAFLEGFQIKLNDVMFPRLHVGVRTLVSKFFAAENSRRLIDLVRGT